MEARFETFLEERNWLIHRSKKESSADLYNDDLRIRMVHRIIAVGEEAQDLRDIIYERTEPFVRARGVDVASLYEVADETIRRLRGDT
jgi:hypothetical protein